MMKQTPENRHVDALDTLLERERTALLTGDLNALTALLPDKEALIESLNAQAIKNLPQAEALGSKVHRNQVLLASALEGMRDVAERMTALRTTQAGLDTYGSDGTRHHIAVKTERSVERRA